MTQVRFNYKLANTAGYRLDIAKIGFNPIDPLAYYHKDNFPDVEISRPGVPTDLSLLHTKCLMTVNGYIHRTQMEGGRLFIPKATQCMLKSRANHVGIFSFNLLADPLTLTSITSDMVSTEANTSMYEKAIITFDHDVGSAILVIAGYMIFEHPEFFYRVSGNSFVLRLDRLNYIEKLYELNRQRHIFADLEIPVSPNNSSVIDADVARGDAAITKFLTTYNSFLVEVPVDSLATRKVYLEHSTVPGNFRTELEPDMPIVIGYGKLGEYQCLKNNDTKHTVYMNDAYYNNFLFSKIPTEDIRIYNDHREVGNTYGLSPAFFLEVTGTVT